MLCLLAIERYAGRQVNHYPEQNTYVPKVICGCEVFSKNTLGFLFHAEKRIESDCSYFHDVLFRLSCTLSECRRKSHPSAHGQLLLLLGHALHRQLIPAGGE